MGFVRRTLWCGFDTRNLSPSMHSEGLRADTEGVEVLTIQCLNWRYLGSTLEGTSGSTITSVYDTSLARSSPSPVLSAFATGRFIGVITISGSSRVSSLINVFPVATSQPVGYATENKRVGVKVGGKTSGIMSSRLRASTIESSGDVIVQVQREVEGAITPPPRPEPGPHPTFAPHPGGFSPDRNGPAK